MQQMKLRTSAFTAAVLALLPSAQPLLLGTVYIAAAATAVALHAPTALAQDASSVARIAKAITVRIEGATQGSGVIVKKDGNSYTVLTAWHVVRSHRPGEELDIFTPDGSRYLAIDGSINKIESVDLATLNFESPKTFRLPVIGNPRSSSMGSAVFVGGFPIPTSAVPIRILRFVRGEVIANATALIPNGYQLLYSNQTLPGMSGGAVFNQKAQLIGIHGQGETSIETSGQKGIAVKTGTNQAVPITYFQTQQNPTKVVQPGLLTPDDFLAKANSVFWQTRKSEGDGSTENTQAAYKEVIKLAQKSLQVRPTPQAYRTMAAAKVNLRDPIGGVIDYSNALMLDPRNIEILIDLGDAKTRGGARDLSGAENAWLRAIDLAPLDPRNARSYYNLGYYNDFGRDKEKAIYFFGQAIELDPNNFYYRYKRANSKIQSNDQIGAIQDLNIALQLNSSYPELYKSLGDALFKLRRYQESFENYTSAIKLKDNAMSRLGIFIPEILLKRGQVQARLGWKSGACTDISQAAASGYIPAQKFLKTLVLGSCN